jgi:excisionase family DNA binding protein
LNSGTEDFDLISVKEASRLLDVSVYTIYNKINAGELQTKRIGSVIRVYKSQLAKINDIK